MPGPETMWRCTACGKWSHAKRMPKRHIRYTHDEPDPDQWHEDLGDGFFVQCGPFERWTAVRDGQGE